MPFVPSPFPVFLDLMIYAICNLVVLKENLLLLLCTHVIISNIRYGKNIQKYNMNIIYIIIINIYNSTGLLFLLSKKFKKKSNSNIYH